MFPLKKFKGNFCYSTVDLGFIKVSENFATDFRGRIESIRQYLLFDILATSEKQCYHTG